jgi:membrane dipeptidase
MRQTSGGTSLIPMETAVLAMALLLLLGLVAMLCVAAQVVRVSRSIPAILGTSLLVAVTFRGVLTIAPEIVEGRINHANLNLPPLYEQLAEENNLSRRLTAADLHADTLLWHGRDLLKRGRVGHVDVPRLMEGNVRIQVFALVIAVPRGLNVERNAKPSGLLHDLVFPKVLLEGWPVRTWTNSFQRALYQCERLNTVASASGGRLTVARFADDLDDLPGNGGGMTRGVLALEGASGIENRGIASLDSLDVLYANGLRILGPTHFFDTSVGGSLSGEEKGGLSKLGFQVVARMKSLSMIVDVAHASTRVVADLAAFSDSNRECRVRYERLSG